MSFKEEFEYSYSVLQRVHSKLYMSPEQQQQTAHSNLFNILCVLGSPLFGQLVDIDTSIKSSQLPHDRENDDAIVSHRNQVSDNGLRKHHCQKQEKQLQSEELHNLQVQQATIQRLANGRQTELIELFKPMDNVSLGFGVVGLYSETHGELGIYVQQIQPESLVARDGRLQENDQILAINNTVLNSTAGLSHQQAIHLLQTVTGHIRLIVAKGPQQSVTSSLSYSSNSSGSKTLISDVQRDSKPTSPAAVIAGGTNDPAGDMVLNTDFVQVEVITLVNDGSGLGFGIIGGKSTGVVVKTILPGGVAERDGRLHSGDHLLQIGEINVRGMGSEQVAAVLRQSGTHVHLIIARSIGEPADEFPPCAPVIPTHQLTDHLRQLNQALILHGEDYPGYIISPEDGLDAIVANGPVANLLLPAEIHQPPQADDIASHEVELFDVELAKGTVGLGITIAGYISDRPSDDLNGIFVRAIGEGSAAALDGRIQVHDQIVAVDGVLLEGYSNQKAVELLRGTGHIIHLKLARHRIGSRYMQMLQSTTSTQIDSINATAPAVVDDVCTIAIDSSYIEPSLIDISDVNNHYDDDIVAELPKDIEDGLISKWQPIVGDNFSIVVAEVVKFKEGGGLGISLEGTVDVENGLELHPHHYIRSVLADGPVGLSGKLEPGDELLQVNESVLYGRNHIEVVSILKELPRHVRVICARRSTSSSATEYNTASCGSDVLRHSLFKAKSEQVLPLAAGTSAAGSVTAGTAATAAAATAGVGLSLRDTMVSGWGQQLNTVTKARSLEPLSAISMWASDVVTIELYKAERGLGFSILDYQDPIDPSQTVIVIRSLVPGGVAQVDGRLVPGDRLLFVNDVNLENASLDKAVQTLKSAPKGPVTIGVAKPLPFPELADLSMDNLLMYDNQSARHCGGTGSLLVCSPSVVSEPSLKPSGTDGYLLMNSRVPPASTSVLPSVDQRGQDVLSNVTTANDSRISSSVACERTIVIEKGADTLGLVVETMDRGVNGCIVKTLVESEAVARDGRIQVGDYIVGVNNDSLRRVTNAQARAVLRKASLHNSDISITYIPAADVSQFNDTWCKQSTDGVNATSTAEYVLPDNK